MPSHAVGRQQFAGAFHERGAPGYEPARQDAVWNGRKPDRFPDAILVAADAQDVVAGVRYAREADLRIGIRSGGHSVAATGVRDGGLLIDVSRLTDVDVDANARTAWIGPGVRGRQLALALGQEGLSFPYGGSPTVGLGGYLLTGGYGLNGKTLGSGASNVTAVDVVTADGELIRADEHQHADYLWAARGGGYGFFGVVVGFRLALHPAPGDLSKAGYVYPVEDFDAFASWFLDGFGGFDRKLMTLVFGVRPPALDQRRVIRIVALGFGEDAEETRRLFAPLETAPIADRLLVREPPSPTTLEEIWAGVDVLYPQGARYLADTTWIADPRDPGLLEGLRPAFEHLPAGGSHVMMNPWVSEPDDDRALSGTTELPLHLYGVGRDPAQDASLQRWITESMEAVLPFSNGVGKVNESDLLLRDQDVLAPTNAARLETLRERLDPERRFHSFLRQEPAGHGG